MESVFHDVKGPIDIDELHSLDSIESYWRCSNIKDRNLTKNEWKLVEDYISKGDSVFGISDEVIHDRLLDIEDLGLEVTISKELISGLNSCVFEPRIEIKDLHTLIKYIRFYSIYIGVEVDPRHRICINSTSNDRRVEFDNESVYKMLCDEVKPFFESYNDCVVVIMKGSPLHMELFINYPTSIIEK